jgi:hypothetical protein
MPNLPVPFPRVAWWETSRPEILNDLDDEPVLPLSEVVFRMMTFLYGYSEQQKDDRYKVCGQDNQTNVPLQM